MNSFKVISSNTFVFICFALIVASTTSSLHAAPDFLTYQGRLQEGGQPANGVRTIQIRLCADSGGASCFSTYPASQGATVINGLFRTTFTVPSTIDLATGFWFLELTVDGNTYLPRERLSGVAYAIYATSASALSAASGSSAVVVSSAMNMSGFSITNAGTINAVSGNFSGQLTVSSATVLTGIGAAQVQLHGNIIVSSETNGALGGGVRVSSNVYIVGFASATKYYGDGSALTGVMAASSTDISISTITASATTPYGGVNIATNTFVVGNVGIGTNSPGAKLEVVGTVKLNQFITQAADTGITLSASDFGKTVTVNSGSAQTVFLPSVDAGNIGAQFVIVKLGAGRVTIQAAAGTYISDSSYGGTIYNNAVVPPYASITLRLATATQWVLIGGEGSWITN